MLNAAMILLASLLILNLGCVKFCYGSLELSSSSFSNTGVGVVIVWIGISGIIVHGVSIGYVSLQPSITSLRWKFFPIPVVLWFYANSEAY